MVEHVFVGLVSCYALFEDHMKCGGMVVLTNAPVSFLYRLIQNLRTRTVEAHCTHFLDQNRTKSNGIRLGLLTFTALIICSCCVTAPELVDRAS